MRFPITAIFGFALALALGLGSAWYMIAEGSPLTTHHIGPWTVWYAAGSPDPDPYTKAYQAREGRLPITSTSALYYHAKTDKSGAPLTSACDYVVDGVPINAMWWSLAVYDDVGKLIPNKADRHAFNRTDIVRSADGSFEIVLSANARQGNWLPAGSAPTLQLMLRIYGPRQFNDTVKGRLIERTLPTITKAGCQ